MSERTFADDIFDMALSMNRVAAMSHGTPQTIERGSPEAIEDARHRRRQAQINARREAQIALYGACPTCGTPYPNETDPCIKCVPSVERIED